MGQGRSTIASHQKPGSGPVAGSILGVDDPSTTSSAPVPRKQKGGEPNPKGHQRARTRTQSHRLLRFSHSSQPSEAVKANEQHPSSGGFFSTVSLGVVEASPHIVPEFRTQGESSVTSAIPPESQKDVEPSTSFEGTVRTSGSAQSSNSSGKSTIHNLYRGICSVSQCVF